MGNLIDTEGLDQYTDEITTFTSGDSSSPSSFTTIPVVTSKEKPSSLFQKLSQAISNIRYLRNQLSGIDGIKITTSAATPVAASAHANNSVAIGYNSIAYANTSISIGYQANARSANNLAIGYNAFSSYPDSIAIGHNASASTVNSITIGHKATSSYSNSIAIGASSNVQSQQSTAIGYLSKGFGAISTAIGYDANVSENSSYYGTAIGAMANVNGTQGTAIGYKSYSSGTNSTAIGQNANTSTDNTIQLGDPNISSLKCKVQLTTTSDIRDKTDIVPIPNAIDFLNEIEPITYVSNMRSLYEHDYKEEVQNEDGSVEVVDNNPYKKYGFTPYDKEEHAKGTKKGERRRSGVSAQNVRDAMIKIYGTDNYANLINDDMYDRENVPPEVESHLGVQYECFVPFLIKAIQELDARVKELEGRT